MHPSTLPHPATPPVDEVADLEAATHSEVKDIALEDVVETDAASGQPAVHQSVDITVQPRAQRKWLTK